MGGLSLATKGMLTRRAAVTIGSGSGGAGLRKEDDIPKPLILVDKFSMSKSTKPDINENTLRVRSVKIVLD
jgi:hypothetical protein